MNPNDVIESYVADVVRRARVKDRQDLGLELRELLTEMLADRAQSAGKLADDEMVLAMLREFGTPADVAMRYGPAPFVIIPPDQSHGFAAIAVIGVLVQWMFSLPTVASGGSLTAWWLTWGLGALWWPGFMTMIALLTSLARLYGFIDTRWNPRKFDPERINRGLVGFGLVWFALGVTFMVALPWLVTQLPPQLAQAFAFDPRFLRDRAPPVLALWLGQFATVLFVYSQGRQSLLTQRLEAAFSVGFSLLLVWWLSGDIFRMKPADDGAHAALAFVLAIIFMDLVHKVYKRRVRIRSPQATG